MITPVVDHIAARPDVDAERIATIGVSQAGYWVPRALAFEKRIAAAVVDPGVFDVSTSWTENLPKSMVKLLEEGEREKFEQKFSFAEHFMGKTTRQTLAFRMKPYGLDSIYEVFEAVRDYKLDDVVDRITTPMLITDPEDEQFWPGQSRRLYEALSGPDKELVRFTAAEGANWHCSRWHAAWSISAPSIGWTASCSPEAGAEDREAPPIIKISLITPDTVPTMNRIARSMTVWLLAAAAVWAGCGGGSSSSTVGATGAKGGATPPRPSPGETARKRLGLPPVAAKPPLPGYLMIADRDNNRIIILSPHKRIVWRFPAPGDLRSGQQFAGPDDAFLTPDGRSIITNEEFSDTIATIRLARQPRIGWEYGHADVPGSGPGYLSHPDDAYLRPNGLVSVADIINCRVVFLDRQHRVVSSIGRAGDCVHDPPHSISQPNGDTPLPDGGRS